MEVAVLACLVLDSRKVPSQKEKMVVANQEQDSCTALSRKEEKVVELDSRKVPKKEVLNSYNWRKNQANHTSSVVDSLLLEVVVEEEVVASEQVGVALLVVVLVLLALELLVEDEEVGRA